MRKRYRVLIFAALVAALVVPVGYALSIESAPVTSQARNSAIGALGSSPAVVPVTAAASVVAPRAIASIVPSAPAALQPLSEAAELVGIGTLLFGLAAFVRKAI